MRTKLIFFLILFAVYAADHNCPVYNFVNQIAKENEVCAYEDAGYLDFRNCTEGLICEPIRFGIESVCVKASQKVVAGEKCEKADDCYSKNCTEKHCVGITVGHACESTAECDKELYCRKEGGSLKGKCTQTTDTCNATIPCATNKFCYHPLGEEQGKCIVYASKEEKTIASAGSAACKTYFTNESNHCVEGPKLKEAGKHACPEDGECVYIFQDKNIKVPCKCGRTNNTAAYCPPGIGDLDLESVICCCNE